MFATEIKTELKRYTEQPLSIWLVPCSLVSSLFSVQPRLPAAFAHYLKAGKESLIFSIHSVSLTERLRCFERREQRGRKKEGGMECWSRDGGWGSEEIQMVKKTRARHRNKKCNAEVGLQRETNRARKPSGFKRKPVI